MPDPFDRLTVAQQKIDELFGPNFAQQHPQLLPSSKVPPQSCLTQKSTHFGNASAHANAIFKRNERSAIVTEPGGRPTGLLSAGSFRGVGQSRNSMYRSSSRTTFLSGLIDPAPVIRTSIPPNPTWRESLARG